MTEAAGRDGGGPQAGASASFHAPEVTWDWKLAVILFGSATLAVVLFYGYCIWRRARASR